MVGVKWLSEKRPNKKRVFYFTSASHALENLRESQIKVSDFGKCNDLFELASVDLSKKAMRVEHSDWVSKVSSKVGLICFSEDWRSTLMWGYYTGNGAGLCLVVDVDQNKLQAVQYVSRREELRSSDKLPKPEDERFRTFCSTKSFHWSHEKEQRFFVNFQPPSPDLFSTDKMNFIKLGGSIDLVGIINGPRAKHTKKDITSAVSRDIPFIQCRPAFRDFRIVMQQDRTLWS